MSAELTPWQEHEGVLVKRDDLYEYAGMRGGKVRTCRRLAEEGLAAGGHGLVTAGSRSSPQVNIVAHVAHELQVPARCYIPSGELLPEVLQARHLGAELVATKPGHNSVIRARAREYAEAEGWVHVPFGMECREAVEETAAQVRGLPDAVGQLVVPVGSGMSLAGILTGLQQLGRQVPVLGVMVGADPTRRLDEWAPYGWRFMVELVRSELPYAEAAPHARLGGLPLDSIYEAKALPYLQPTLLGRQALWVVGIRASEAHRPEAADDGSWEAWFNDLPRGAQG